MKLAELDPNESYEKIDENMVAYIYLRDNNICQLCSKQGNEIHHIVFRSKKRGHMLNNLVLLCMNCHRGSNGVHGTKENVQELLTQRVARNEKILRTRLC